MHTVELDHPADFDGWRTTARRLLQEDFPPEQIVWQCPGTTADLFGASGSLTASGSGLQLQAAAPDASSGAGNSSGLQVRAEGRGGKFRGNGLKVSRDFVDLARRVVCHRDPSRFALLYRLLWRQVHGEPRLLRNACDEDVYRASVLGKSVGRDMHKMRAFLRFRRSSLQEADHYHAWFEPEHHVLRYNCEFFQRRFAAMHWSIATPEASAHWNGVSLHFGPPVARDTLPDSEPMEDLWRTYFASIFNPARLRLNAMRSEMPMKYWKNLPEASLIAPLSHQAGSRTGAMVAAAPTRPPRFAARALHGGNEPVRAGIRTKAASAGATSVVDGPVATAVPDGQMAAAIAPLPSLASLADEVKRCMQCAHACHATQAVPGNGPSSSDIMLVGEQPGDREDLEGLPFVGPAGLLLRELLAACGCDASSVYTTNAVKHFKFTVRGKLRLHQKPSEQDIAACQPWLQREIELVAPRVIVALGASAARALLGRPVKILAERGRWQPFGEDCQLWITTHPSFVLRQRTPADRQRARETLQQDLLAALAPAINAGAASAAPVV